jgi:hypothetical protein
MWSQMNIIIHRLCCLQLTTFAISHSKESILRSYRNYHRPRSHPFAKQSPTLRPTTPFHRAIQHLHRLSTHPHTHQPLPHFAQPRRRLLLTPPVSVRVLRPAPEHFCSCGCARPEHLVQIGGIGLLGPEVHFAAEDEVVLGERDVGEGGEGVNGAPVVVGGAVCACGVR